MKKHLYILISLVFINQQLLLADVEVVPISNPVYQFLSRGEVKGMLGHHTLTDIPFQKNEVIEALRSMKKYSKELTNYEQEILIKYLMEFDRDFSFDDKSANKTTQQNAVLFRTDTINKPLLWKNIISDKEKYIYQYSDSLHSIGVKPLFSFETVYSDNDNQSYQLAQVGGRIYGTLGKHLGYSLQATNGPFFSGDRSLAMLDNKLKKNVKFGILNNDIDLSCSQVIFQYNWFYASMERVNRLIGAGLNQKTFMSDIVPPVDALNVGVKFPYFKYRYSHSGIIGYVDSSSYWESGFETTIPAKYLLMHRFTFTPKWGEISFWESIIYSNRSIELAYLNPLSFMKTLEHSLHDRDNSLMGLDFVVRPIKKIQIESSFLLDDIKFEEIGKNYWSNKMAFNFAIKTALPYGIDLGMEYARVEPYTYTHFNNQNSYTSDSLLIGSILMPNSDRMSLDLNYWYGSRYPLKISIAYIRHGDNIYDEEGKLIRNVGGNPNEGHRYTEDSQKVVFLDGIKNDYYSTSISLIYEVVRGINISCYYGLYYFENNELLENRFRLAFSIGDF